MKENIPVLHCKLKKYERKSKKKSEDGSKQVTRRYMIPVKKEQIEGSNFENVEDIVILNREDFDLKLQKSNDENSVVESLEQSLKNKDNEIIGFRDLINKKDNELKYVKYLQETEIKEVQLKFKTMQEEYESEIRALTLKIEQFRDIDKQYENINTKNKELEREIKRLSDLRALEKESFRIKLNEMELTQDEYDKLKKSHEMLWDVVQEKDNVIRDLEKNGVVSTILKKIRKKEGA